MRKYRVGVLTFSDGRKYQHEQLLPTNRDYQQRVKKAIEGTGEVEVIEGREIIWRQCHGTGRGQPHLGSGS